MNLAFDKVTLDHLRTLPDGTLTRAEVNLMIDSIERLAERVRALTDAGDALAAVADPLLSDEVSHFSSAWEIDPHHGLDGEKLADSLQAAVAAWRR